MSFRQCIEEGCKAKCMEPHYRCARHRMPEAPRKMTPERREARRAADRRRNQRKGPSVLAGREVIW